MEKEARSLFALSANQRKGVKWLMDTGCGHDSIGKSKAASLGVDIVQDKDEIVFQTANGIASTSDSIKYYVNELKKTVQPFVRDDADGVIYWSTMRENGIFFSLDLWEVAVHDNA